MTDFTHLLQKADTIVEEYHRGQTDKAGADYIEHPRRVSAHCNTIKVKIVVLLHDTYGDIKSMMKFMAKNDLINKSKLRIKALLKQWL
jgi:(p)ppGpp synthase/HD superfamily hydrolase